MTDERSIDQSRREYARGPLELEHLDEDAIVQFQQWFEEACERVDLEPNAMTLATVDSNGAPAVRVVLLKFFDHAGFVFFTNLASRKSVHIEGNKRVALLFWWPELERQIEIDGVAERISSVEAAKCRSRRSGEATEWYRAASSFGRVNPIAFTIGFSTSAKAKAGRSCGWHHERDRAGPLSSDPPARSFARDQRSRLLLVSAQRPTK